MNLQQFRLLGGTRIIARYYTILIAIVGDDRYTGVAASRLLCRICCDGGIRIDVGCGNGVDVRVNVAVISGGVYIGGDIGCNGLIISCEIDAVKLRLDVCGCRGGVCK